MLTRRRALRDFQDFRNLVENTWNTIAAEDNATKSLDEFTYTVFGDDIIRYGRNAMLTLVFRLHQIRVDALSDGRRRDPNSGQIMEVRSFSDAVATAIAPRVQIFAPEFDVDTISGFVFQWFPVSIKYAEEMEFNPEHRRPLAALTLALAADFTDWDSLSEVYSLSGFRKALTAIETKLATRLE